MAAARCIDCGARAHGRPAWIDHYPSCPTRLDVADYCLARKLLDHLHEQNPRDWGTADMAELLVEAHDQGRELLTQRPADYQGQTAMQAGLAAWSDSHTFGSDWCEACDHDDEE